MNDEKFLKFIFRYGKKYIPARIPESVARGPVGQCFDVSLHNALRTPFRYVEGIARDPRNPDRWVLHAWLTDGMFAYDPTWGAETPIGFLPILTEYVGVEIAIDPLGQFVMATEYKSVFANGWRDVERARRCFPFTAGPLVPTERISDEFYIPKKK